MRRLIAVIVVAVLGGTCAPADPAAPAPPLTPDAFASPLPVTTPDAVGTATIVPASPPATSPPSPLPAETPGAVPDIPGTYAVSGPWIVYQAVYSNGVDLGLVRPDGSDAHQIPPGEWERWHPDWSPDGTRILYGRWTPATESESVGVVNPDGSDDRVLLACDDPCLFTGAHWSRDGRLLLFYRIEQRDEGGACLMGVHDLETGNETIVTEHAGTEHEGCASWDSPLDTSLDAQTVLFQRETAGAVALFLIDVDGTDEQQLTDWGVGARADWSPDGEWIIFQDKEREPPEPGVSIWRVQPDGTNLEQLTHPQGPARDLYPRWLPDGSGIIFSRCVSLSNCETRVIDPEGSTDRLLFGELGNQTVHVVWQPPNP